MARIKIEDLPVTETITPEEAEELLGAGRRPFQPNFEALEGRELMDAALAHALPIPAAPARGGDAPQLAHVRVLEAAPAGGALQALTSAGQVPGRGTGLATGSRHQAAGPAVSNADLDAFWSSGGIGGLDGGASPATQLHLGGVQSAGPRIGDWTEKGFHYIVREYQEGSSPQKSYEVQIFDLNKGNARVVWGNANQQTNWTFVVQSNPGAPGAVTRTFDKFGGQVRDGAWVPGDDQQMISLNGNPVTGSWAQVAGQRRWVEATGSTSDSLRTEVYEGFGQRLLYVNVYTNGNAAGGKFKYREERSEGNVLTRRFTEYADGSQVQGDLQGDKTWKEFIVKPAPSSAFTQRVEYYDQADGAHRSLISRDTTFADGRTVHGEWQPVLGGNRWVETTTGSKEFTDRTEVYDKPDGTRLSSLTNRKDGSSTYGDLRGDVKGDLRNCHWVEMTFTGEVKQVRNDGVVVLGTPNGGEAFYRHVGGSWKLVGYNRHENMNGDKWVEESWAADGTYTKKVWETGNPANPKDGIRLLSQAVVANGKATITFYHNGRTPYMWGSAHYIASDAQVTYVYSVDANGKLGEMSSFELVPDGRTDWANRWTKDGGWDTNDGGWVYDFGGKGRPAEMGVKYGSTWGQNGESFTIGWAVHLDPGVSAAAVPPGMTVKTEEKQNGTHVETFSDKGHTQVIQFVYSGSDKAVLVQQTTGHMVNGTWVQDTTRPQNLAAWVEDRLKAGGNTVTKDDPRQNRDGTITITYHVQTPDQHWDIDDNKMFKQHYSGTVSLVLKKVGTVDGVEQYSVVKVTHEVSLDQTRVNWNPKAPAFNYHSPGQNLSDLGVTEQAIEAVVFRWNERAVL